MSDASTLTPPVHALLIGAARCALSRRVSLARRQRLGDRIYDGSGLHRLNPLGCTVCQLPFDGAAQAEVCPLCVSEQARRDFGAIATANCLAHIYAAMEG